MASSPMLKAGIETDIRTLTDQVSDNDVTFPIKAHEVIEVYRHLDGKLTPMLVLPKDAGNIEPPPFGKPRINADRSGLVVVASAAIMTPAGERGVLVLAVPVSLDGMRSRVEPHVKQASLVGLGAPVPLVQGPSSGSKVSIPITVESNAPLKLEAVLR